MTLEPIPDDLPAKRVRGKVEKITQHEIDEINDHYHRIHKAAEEVAAEIISLGEKLASIKNRLPYGRWGKWVEKNLKFTIRTATRCMKAYEKRLLLLSVEPEDFMAAIWGNEPKQLENKSDVESTSDVTSDLTEQEEEEHTQHGGEGFNPGFFPEKTGFLGFRNLVSHLDANFFWDPTVPIQKKLEFIEELIKWLEDRKEHLTKTDAL